MSQSLYDERGQVYKTKRHKIDQSDGSDDDNLESDFWYDIAGRRIKVQGEELGKTVYDRLGRVTHRFVLGKALNSGASAETAYADADDVDHDVVVEEHQSVYDDDTGSVLFSVSILRHPTQSATTYGALDTNADTDRSTITATNVRGRVQITANWYDNLDRLTSTVAYGTNTILGDGSTSGGDFTRPGSAPSRPNTTTSQTDYDYDDAGNLVDTVDPLGIVTRSVYDDAGRRITAIANRTGSSPTGDADVHTRYVYTSGLLTKTWVDLDADTTVDAGDQVTSYYYGVTTGGSAKYSLVNSNRLLHAVVDPDSTNTGTTSSAFYTTDTDAVTLAYNALGQEIFRKDQEGNELETEFDTAGRVTVRKVSTLASGFDGAVRRIETAYTPRGMVDTVTQHKVAGGSDPYDQVQFDYDGWGNLKTFKQDPDSLITCSSSCGRGSYQIDYTFAKAIPPEGRWTVRRDTLVLPGSQTVDYEYGSGLNASLSRVHELAVGGVSMAIYTYGGSSWLTGTISKPQEITNQLHHASTLGSYPGLDTYNRVSTSHWFKDNAGTDPDIYKTSVTYNLAGSVTSTTDQVLMDGSGDRRFDVLYDLDGLRRVKEADEGTLSGGSISNRRTLENWGLDQMGNFDTNQVDLDGNGSISGADIDDLRVHDTANEITSWRPAGSGGSTYTVTSDKAGNMTNDGKDYKFVYDPFGRLKEVKNQSNTLVSEYRYNGLGYRTGWHYDTDTDSDVDGNDPWFYFAYDESWRLVATYRDADSSPKERFGLHAAGLGGFGGSGVHDAVAWRDRDMSKFGSAVTFVQDGDGTLEEQRFYCHNWRGDVVAIVTGGGVLVEKIKYSLNGVPFGLPAGDTDSDGDADGTDTATITAWFIGTTYDARGDINLDGAVNGTDETLSKALDPTALGRTKLTRSENFNRKGFGGYENDGVLGVGGSRFWHASNRVLDGVLGRWSGRGLSNVHVVLEYHPKPRLAEFVNERSFGTCTVKPGAKTPCYVSGIHLPRPTVQPDVEPDPCNDRIWNEPKECTASGEELVSMRLIRVEADWACSPGLGEVIDDALRRRRFPPRRNWTHTCGSLCNCITQELLTEGIEDSCSVIEISGVVAPCRNPLWRAYIEVCYRSVTWKGQCAYNRRTT